jgi:hypothetical protein
MGEGRDTKNCALAVAFGPALTSISRFGGQLCVETQLLLEVAIAAPRPDRRHQARNPFAKLGYKHG